MKSLRLFALAPLAILSVSAHAASDVTGKDYFYLGTGAVGVSSDPVNVAGAGTLKFKDSEIYENPNLTIGVGHYYSKHFAVEGFYRYSRTEGEFADDSMANLDTHQFALSGLATTGRIWKTPFELYAKLTGTYTYSKFKADNFDVDDEDGVGGLNISGGLQWDLMNSDYFFRAEYVYALTMGDLYGNDDYDYKGVQISLGRTF
ncbi:MAG: porin family protein [Vibrio litoralis]|uniref:porin family protein n=1 Tax=Vibrio litoralis TaxID=335972 RepID=UPI003F9A004C